MSKPADFIEILKAKEEILSKRARDFFKALQQGSVDRQKRTKVIRAVLYETLVKYKEAKSPGASEVIIACLKSIVAEWRTLKDSASLQMPSLLKAALKRACGAEKDMIHLKELGHIIEDYFSIVETSDDEVTSWFLFGAAQFCKSEHSCACLSGSECDLLKSFYLELQASKVRGASKGEIYDAIDTVLSTTLRHLGRCNFTKEHLHKVLSALDVLIMKNNGTAQQLYFSNLIKSVVTAEGNLLLGEKNLAQPIEDIYEFSKTFVREKSKCPSYISTYLTIFCHHLSTLAKHCEKLKTCIWMSIKCIDLLCSIGGKSLTTEILASVAYFCHKASAVVNMKDICKQITTLISFVGEDYKQKSLDGEALVRFLETVVHMCANTFNHKGEQNLDRTIENCLEKLLDLFPKVDLTENPRMTVPLMNIGTVLAKTKRSLGDYLSAMDIVEAVIKMSTFDNVKVLVAQWVKAKRNAILENKKLFFEKAALRTMASNLRGNIPENALTEILCLELELYESLSFSGKERLAVLQDLLLHDCEKTDILRPGFTCKLITLQFELQTCSPGEIDYASAYEICKAVAGTWEDFIKIKLVEFLENWNKLLGSAVSEGESSLNVNLNPILDVADTFEQAVKENFPVLHMERTCEVAHKASAVLALFGYHLRTLSVMGALWLLLHKDYGKKDSSVRGTQLWYLSSALCEISSSYLALRQLSTAEKYSKLALSFYDKYVKWWSECNSGNSDQKLKKILFFKVQAVLAQVLGRSGKDEDAKKILDHCLEDEFLQKDNLRKSLSAIICSVEVLKAFALILDDFNPRICRLQSWLKRIISLQASILPAFHLLQKSPSSSKVQSFGVGEHGNHHDVSVQIKLVDYSFEALLDLAETSISMGSPKSASAYVQVGLVRAKYLHLKRWYVRFCLTRVKILSLTDDKSFSLLCKNFCELVQCECKLANGYNLEDSFLQKDEEDEFQMDEDHAESEIYGSTDDDAIRIPSRPLDAKSFASSADDFMASPAVAKCKRRQPLTLPPIFQKKKKSCSCEVTLSFQAIQLEYGNIFAEYCTRTYSPDDGMEICAKLLTIFVAMKNKTMLSSLENIDVSGYFNPFVAETHIINSQLSLLKNGEKADALTFCEAAKTALEKCDVSDPKTSLLKSKIHFFTACVMEDMDVIVPQPLDPSYLNAVIDGIASVHVADPVAEVHTPVLNRSRRKTAPSKAVKNTSARGRTVKATRPRKTKDSESFTIFEDKENKHSLPVPQYITDHSPLTCEKDTYKFESSDDERKLSAKKLLKDTQNIKLARKMASRKHKNQFGMVYIDNAKEKVRGRTVKSQQAKRQTSSKNKAVPLAGGTPRLDSCSEVSCTPENLAKHVSDLQQALSSACDAGDFLISKLSAQRLSQCYYAAYCKSLDPFQLSQSAVFHLFSIGVVTRGTMQVYAKASKDIHSCGSQNGGGDGNVPGDEKLLKYTDSRKILRTVLEGDIQYITEIVDLLPENWTVCAISLCKSTRQTKLLVTRLNRGKSSFHFQSNGEVLEQILTKFDDLMDRNIEALKSRDKAYWWTQRRNLDTELKALIDSLGKDVLGHYSGVLQGVLKNSDVAGELKKCIKEIAGKFAFSQHETEAVEILLNSWSKLSPEDKFAGIFDLCGATSTKDYVALVARELETISAKLLLEKESRHHVILILDKDVQLLPWENVPQLQGCSVTRLPSVDLLGVQLGLLKSAENSIATHGVNLKNVSYVLNPNGDLTKSEERFQEWFQSIKSWKGIISREPLQNEWVSSITDFDLFIFCGHGAGTKYMSTNDFRKVQTRAAALLMGCGSAKLDQDGIFEPDGIVLHYLITGSPCVLGCLWKITDKDIDIYLCKLLEYWANGENVAISTSAAKAQCHMKMPHINGAACVTYGLPIHCQVTIANFVQSLPKI